MIKLNKCRTLFDFNEVVLKTLNGQTESVSQQDSTDQTSQAVSNQEETKEVSNHNGSQATKTDASANNKTSQNLEGGNNTEKADGSNEQLNNDNNQETSQNQSQLQYLYFQPDEFLITTYQSDNGWWYGYKDIDISQPEAMKYGFYPSNYVQVIEEYEQPSQADAQAESEQAQTNQDSASSWADYARDTYLDDTQILVQERVKKLNDFTAPENRNPDGILGYKKIKIHESRSHAVNPWKGGEVQSSQVAIKDQSAVSKAYRQMNHYFDYDEWIDDRNKNPVPKAKADPTKKKKKSKVLNW